MDGIINVRKEKGYTSFDVVAILRGILHEKKIGHCGTLDPDAEGVLVVCAGHATKLVDLLTAHEKTYRTVMRLGITTDTQDISGEILSSVPVQVTEGEITGAVHTFTGETEQLPPMYSAVKVNGKKLCDYARAGKKVDRKPRKVFIYEIIIEKIDLPDVEMTVRCSKGTYIRTLCEDIGRFLGCGAAMASLMRVKSGAFSIEDAWTLDEIRKEMAASETMTGTENVPEEGAQQRIPGFLKPLDTCFYDLPSVTVTGEKDILVQNGNPVRLSEKWFRSPEYKSCFFDEDADDSESRVRVYLEDGTFAGVYQYIQEKRFWKPWKMFLTAEQGVRPVRSSEKNKKAAGTK